MSTPFPHVNPARRNVALGHPYATGVDPLGLPKRSSLSRSAFFFSITDSVFWNEKSKTTIHFWAIGVDLNNLHSWKLARSAKSYRRWRFKLKAGPRGAPRGGNDRGALASKKRNLHFLRLIDPIFSEIDTFISANWRFRNYRRWRWIDAILQRKRVSDRYQAGLANLSAQRDAYQAYLKRRVKKPRFRYRVRRPNYAFPRPPTAPLAPPAL